MANYIIVEGPDGAGKTTLIEKLIKSHPGAKYLHFGVPTTTSSRLAYYASAIKEFAKEHTVIMDRCWYSDAVYAPIMRNKTEITSVEVESLEALIVMNGGGMVIWCTARPEILWKRCKTRGETYIQDIEQLDKIRIAYETVMTHATLPVVKFDTGK